MHLVQAKSILSAQNGMNVYRGCQHGCIYCDSRSVCYHMDHIFEDIEVKANAPELLEKALSGKRSRCMIGTGSMSDPYLPLEKKLRLTRRCLEIIERYGFGATLLTKSDGVLRDLDLLKAINRKARCVVQMTLTTLDDKLCSVLEPNVCNSTRRLEVLRKLRDEGIPTIVWLSPILPFINDTEENIMGILEGCDTAGVKGIVQFGIGLTLRDGDREYYYSQLDRHFPGMKRRYIETYGSSYVLMSPNEHKLMYMLESFCSERGIMSKSEECFEFLRRFDIPRDCEQLSFFD